MNESRTSRGFRVSASAVVCAVLGLAYVQATLGGCAESLGGGTEEEGSSSNGDGKSSGDPGDTGDFGDTGDTGDTGDPSSGADGAGPTGTSGGNSTSGATSGGPQTGGACCVASGSPGCQDMAVEQCVCAQDDYCCTTEWNDECVFLVDDLGCGTCGASSSSAASSGGNPSGDCCSPAAGPGCSDPAVEQCVCQEDDYCCTTEWNDLCVQLVDEIGCGNCGGASSSGGGGDQCCSPSSTPGCADPSIEQCVCAQDSFCCMDSWDDTCVSEVADFGCGFCM